ncbi:hypothetical protein PE067_08200 [Paracoccus sp. DMF-8]|nr:hypothetical protein [Paracoccus sp. DMF-8]MDF3606109.1 hypothetical protein [Paracoccus sp. DMF-8]
MSPTTAYRWLSSGQYDRIYMALMQADAARMAAAAKARAKEGAV